MASHQIKLQIARGIEVVNTDISVIVKRNGKIFGTLTLSKGTIDWRPKRKHVGGKSEKSLTWLSFDKRMRGE